MEEQVIKFLIKEYSPNSIIIHGSRGGYYARENSDWDIMLFTKSNNKKPKREPKLLKYKEQYLDIMIWRTNISDEKIHNHLLKIIGSARLVHKKSQSDSIVFKRLKDQHKHGLILDSTDIDFQLTLLEKETVRLTDWLYDETMVFELRCYEIFNHLYSLWWKIKRRQYPVSPRIGLSEIKFKDEEFYTLLMSIITQNERHRIIKIIDGLRNRLFN